MSISVGLRFQFANLLELRSSIEGKKVKPIKFIMRWRENQKPSKDKMGVAAVSRVRRREP